MSRIILLDNDVALKACAYRCHSELVAVTKLDENPPAMLGIARFTLRTCLSRSRSVTDRESALTALNQLLAQVNLLIPTPSEIKFAAELEEQATARALEFDTGESQLVAILLSRGAELLITGDKRAIAALAGLALTEIKGRIACFEQLIAILLIKYPHNALRQRVCAESEADKALTACFACSSGSVSVDDIFCGLASYTSHLRKETDDTLIADADLSAIIS